MSYTTCVVLINLYLFIYFINHISYGLSDSVAPMGGGLRGPPSEIKEGVIFDPMLLYSICCLVFLGVTCNQSARNPKI